MCMCIYIEREGERERARKRYRYRREADPAGAPDGVQEERRRHGRLNINNDNANTIMTII